MAKLSHFDEKGASRMVDVRAKPETHRSATASAKVRMAPETLALIQNKELSKGDVLEVARIAGIQAAKKTGELIPLCHPLPLTAIRIELTCLPPETIAIEATVEVFGRTGVEMEALTAVSIAALTVYDMAKAVDRGMRVEEIRLERKSGGQSGDYTRPAG
jgi:cyclic pyranopterin phosphate synthase